MGGTMRSLVGIMALLVSALAFAQEGQGTTAAAGGWAVERAVVGTSVENREIVGEAASFPATVGEVACLMKVTGPAGEATIAHVWKRGATEMAKVTLKVNGPTWRTWSMKKIPAGATGEWTIEIQTADGTVLKSVNFTISSS